ASKTPTRFAISCKPFVRPMPCIRFDLQPFL
ncbi:MAG: hypothetical protein EB125_02850, partial [Betaproteobacteria bacterium]|nr:hypothetical protein [Betaproteobacteria bacterium]